MCFTITVYSPLLLDHVMKEIFIGYEHLDYIVLLAHGVLSSSHTVCVYLLALSPSHTAHTAYLMIRLLIKSDWTFYDCVNPCNPPACVCISNRHLFLVCLCCEHMDILCYRCGFICLINTPLPNSVIAPTAQSLVISSAVNKCGCYKIINIYMRWLTMPMCMFCLCCIFMRITIIWLHPQSINTYETSQQLIFVCHSPLAPAAISEWPQVPLYKCVYGYIWLEVLIKVLLLSHNVIMMLREAQPEWLSGSIVAALLSWTKVKLLENP